MLDRTNGFDRTALAVPDESPDVNNSDAHKPLEPGSRGVQIIRTESTVTSSANASDPANARSES